MIVTLASGLPRTGRLATSILNEGSLTRSKVSRRASLVLSEEMRNSTGVVFGPWVRMTERLSYPGIWLGFRGPRSKLYSGGMLNLERTMTSIRRVSAWSSGAGEVDWALQPAANAKMMRLANK